MLKEENKKNTKSRSNSKDKRGSKQSNGNITTAMHQSNYTQNQTLQLSAISGAQMSY